MAALIAAALTGTILARVDLPGPSFRLCHGLVPGCERRREGRDDQVAHAHGRRLN